MLDTQEQLARLKQRIAAIDARYVRPQPARTSCVPIAYTTPAKTARWFIEEWSEGQVINNACGAHFQTERLFASHKRHGSADIGALADLPQDHLGSLSVDEIPRAPAERWAFLDTETTGLAGGCGTYAFLIGIGRITPEGFRVRQYLMREYSEERSVLLALEQDLSEFEVLITYNGKTYDQPLLETRYRMLRQNNPLERLPHYDLLHGARRLWKLRLESCRLIELEEQILGFYREGDLPGELIPYVYFEYVRSQQAQRLVPIFHHNAMDILTLACLTAIVPAAFRAPDPESLARTGVNRGEDLASIGRWLLAENQYERALDLFKRAVDVGLPDPLLFRTLWQIALLEKKLEHTDAALRVFMELATCRNEYRVCALEELAKHYEHKGKDCASALEYTNQALRCQTSAALGHRKARLEKRLENPRVRKLL